MEAPVFAIFLGQASVEPNASVLQQELTSPQPDAFVRLSEQPSSQAAQAPQAAVTAYNQVLALTEPNAPVRQAVLTSTKPDAPVPPQERVST